MHLLFYSYDFLLYLTQSCQSCHLSHQLTAQATSSDARQLLWAAQSCFCGDSTSLLSRRMQSTRIVKSTWKLKLQTQGWNSWDSWQSWGMRSSSCLPSSGGHSRWSILSVAYAGVCWVSSARAYHAWLYLRLSQLTISTLLSQPQIHLCQGICFCQQMDFSAKACVLWQSSSAASAAGPIFSCHLHPWFFSSQLSFFLLRYTPIYSIFVKNSQEKWRKMLFQAFSYCCSCQGCWDLLWLPAYRNTTNKGDKNEHHRH